MDHWKTSSPWHKKTSSQIRFIATVYTAIIRINLNCYSKNFIIHLNYMGFGYFTIWFYYDGSSISGFKRYKTVRGALLSLYVSADKGDMRKILS